MCPNSYFSQRNNQKLIRHSITYRVLDMDFIFHIVLQQRHQKKNVKTSIVKELNRKRPRHYRQKEVESIENHSVIILCLQIKQILVHTKSKLQKFRAAKSTFLYTTIWTVYTRNIKNAKREIDYWLAGHLVGIPRTIGRYP